LSRNVPQIISIVIAIVIHRNNIISVVVVVRRNHHIAWGSFNRTIISRNDEIAVVVILCEEVIVERVCWIKSRLIRLTSNYAISWIVATVRDEDLTFSLIAVDSFPEIVDVHVKISVAPIIGVLGGQSQTKLLILEIKGCVILVEKCVSENPSIHSL